MLASQTRKILYASASILIVFSLLVLVYVYANGLHSTTQDAAKSRKNAAVVANSIGAKHYKLSPDQQREKFEELLTSPDFLHFDSLEEASPELPFELHDPKYPGLQGKSVTVLITSDERKEDRAVSIYYGDPVNPVLFVSASRALVKDPNAFYDGLLEQYRTDKEKGYLKSDSLPRMINVKGHKGLGSQPGYNLIGNAREPRPGFVSFMADGVLYKVFGTTGENGTGLEELMNIAESLFGE